MIGVYKLLISVAVIIVIMFIREMLISNVLGAHSSEEADYHFKVCMCILLAAWIIREGMW